MVGFLEREGRRNRISTEVVVSINMAERGLVDDAKEYLAALKLEVQAGPADVFTPADALEIQNLIDGMP